MQMRLTKQVILIMLFSFVLTNEANGAPPDSQIWAEVKIAKHFWTTRGIIGCEIITPEIAPLPPGVTGQADQGGCAFTIASWVAKETRDKWSGRRYALKIECATVVHEMGHALGWMPAPRDIDPFDPYHSLDGLMSADSWDLHIPYECKVWANRMATR